jgi:hypothetical protein
MPRGKIKGQGIPFKLSADGSSARFIALGKGIREVSAPLRGKATHVCIFHFCDVVKRERKGTAAGDILAEYVLSFSDGTEHIHPIRKRFEIDSFGAGRGRGAFAALPYARSVPTSAEDKIPYGRAEAGVGSEFRTTFQADIYALENPTPDKTVSGLTFRWKGGLSMGILGLTLYKGPGHPLRLERRGIMTVSLPTSEKADLSEVEAEVDLGHVTRLSAAPPKPGKGWTEEESAGLGAKVQPKAGSEFHVEATAAKGATLKIKAGKKKPHTFELARMYEKGATKSLAGKARIRMLHRERTWVHARVLDGSTGKPTPTRIHFSGPRGEYLPPHGHHSEDQLRLCAWGVSDRASRW